MTSVKRQMLRRIFFITAVFLIILTILHDRTSVLKLAYPLKYRDMVVQYSIVNNLDPFFVFSVMKAESSFIPDAISVKKARGLMQLTENTALWGARVLKLDNFNVEQLFQPEINIRLGTWYLGMLMEEYAGDAALVAAAYNGGNGNVNGWLKNPMYSDSGITLDRIPIRETEVYVDRVMNNYYVYKSLYQNR